jgi:hypothetical protein
MEFHFEREDSARYPPSKTPVTLQAAGIQLLLPAGTRIHPGAVKRLSELVQVRGQFHSLFFWASFYSEGASVFGSHFLKGLQANLKDDLQELLFGGARLLEAKEVQVSGGRVLLFDLQPQGTRRREALVVGLPTQGAGLVTLTFQYDFDPGARRAIRGIAEKITFSTGN